jgi:hypothetical protein
MIGLQKELRRKRVVDHWMCCLILLVGFTYRTIEELCVRMGVHMVLWWGFCMAIFCEERDGFLGCYVWHLNFVKIGLQVEVLAYGIANETRIACVWLGEAAYEFWRDMTIMYLWRGATLSMTKWNRRDWSQLCLFWMWIWIESKGCVWATLNCDSVQTWGRGALDLVQWGRQLLLVREVCHRVKFVRGTLTKQCWFRHSGQCWNRQRWQIQQQC